MGAGSSTLRHLGSLSVDGITIDEGFIRVASPGPVIQADPQEAVGQTATRSRSPAVTFWS